jgi:hypothetical protein
MCTVRAVVLAYDRLGGFKTYDASRSQVASNGCRLSPCRRGEPLGQKCRLLLKARHMSASSNRTPSVIVGRGRSSGCARGEGSGGCRAEGTGLVSQVVIPSLSGHLISRNHDGGCLRVPLAFEHIHSAAGSDYVTTQFANLRYSKATIMARPFLIGLIPTRVSLRVQPYALSSGCAALFV